MTDDKKPDFSQRLRQRQEEAANFKHDLRMLANLARGGVGHVRTHLGVAALEATRAERDEAAEAAAPDRDRLRECMRRAGLTAFIRDGEPEDVANHLRGVIQSYIDATEKAERERDALREGNDLLMRQRDHARKALEEMATLVNENARLRHGETK